MKLLRKELFFSFFKCNRTELKTTLNVWLTFTLNSVPNVSMYLLETSHATNYGTGLGLYVFNKVRRGKNRAGLGLSNARDCGFQMTAHGQTSFSR